MQKYGSAQGMPLRDTALEEKGQKTRQKIVTFVECSGCNYKDTKTKKNQEQSFISGEKLKNVWYESYLEAWKWKNNETGSRVKYAKCRRKDIIVEEKILEKEKKNIWCPEYRIGKKQPWQNQRVMVHPKQGKAQQSDTWAEAPKSIAREKGKQKEVRRIFKMLKEVWLNIRIKKVNMHKGVIVKALLDSGTIGMFIDKKIVTKHGFRL